MKSQHSSELLRWLCCGSLSVGSAWLFAAAVLRRGSVALLSHAHAEGMQACAHYAKLQ
jgi:hypothetical protein